MGNIYDDPVFFEKYSQMERSKSGLAGAGEWNTLRPMLPDFSGRRVLDLGCGYGWHCRWAAEHGAESVVGADCSEKMLERARSMTGCGRIKYIHKDMEELDWPPGSFDVILSSLSFHYVRDFAGVVRSAASWLSDGGDFVFSVEHPVFTAQGGQDWYRSETGEILHFPVDNYFCEGERDAVFLGEHMVKYHRTLTTYFRTLTENGFAVLDMAEPMPDGELLERDPAMRMELRRPMMLIIAAKKRGTAL